jgi:hypothetical protein
MSRRPAPCRLVAALAVMLLLGAARTGQAQERSLEETISVLSADAAEAYLAPVSKAFGANLNSGWFHRAPRPERLGFHFEAGLVAAGSFFAAKDRSFAVAGRFRLSAEEAWQLVSLLEQQQGQLPIIVRQALVTELTADPSEVGISGATVIGSADERITIAYPGATHRLYGRDYFVPAAEFELPFGGFGEWAGLDLLPLAVPQFGIGTLWGTRATLRWLPALELEDGLGEYRYFGYGLEHNPAVWFGRRPALDLAICAYRQRMELGNLFTSRSSAWGLTASRQFGWRFLNATPYAGILFERAGTRVAYDLRLEVPASPQHPDGQLVESIRLELDGANCRRIVLGLSLRLGVLNWNFDASLAESNSLSMGLSFIL